MSEQISAGQFALRAVVILAVLCVVAAFAFRRKETPPAAAPAAAEQRGDYLSTVMRARKRTNESLEKSARIRSELKAEEEAFDKKGTPTPAATP